MARCKQHFVLIDGLSPYDTRETWERHLAYLKRLPASVVLKPELMQDAREMIAKKRAGLASPIAAHERII
jgi:hypothetical protein